MAQLTKTIALAACLLSEVGCTAWTQRAHFFVSATNTPAPPATHAAAIEFYFLLRPQRAFRVVGTIFTENRDMSALREAAAARGCHALILHTPPRFFPSLQPCTHYESPKIEAVCVRYSP